MMRKLETVADKQIYEVNEMHIYEVVKKNGSLYLKYTFNGSNYQSEDYMKIYGIGRTPYVKRMGTKINLTAEMIEMMNKCFD